MISAGDIFGRLTVKEFAEKKNGKRYWLCQCVCGTTKIVQESHLLTGHTKSCGCLSRGMKASRAVDLRGQRFGRLIALEKTAKRKKQCVVWKCLCDCGKEIECSSEMLTRGKVRSCGCLQEETRKENMEKAIHFVDGTCIEKIASQNLISTNTSGHRGVSRRKNGTWRACLNFQGKRYDLGTYQTFEEAVAARLDGESMYKNYLEEYYKKIMQMLDKDKM